MPARCTPATSGASFHPHRLLQAGPQRAWRIIPELEARAGLIRESRWSTVYPVRRRRGDGHRAIPQAVHLVQPAGLEPRRHEEDVRATSIGSATRSSNPNCTPTRSAPLAQRLPKVLVARLARPEQDERRVRPQEAFANRRQQVESLLSAGLTPSRQWGRKGHRRDGQAHDMEQGTLRRALRVERVRAVQFREMRIPRGVPHVDVDAVQNADDAIAAAREDPFETEPELGRLDFARVAWADRRDNVAEVNPRF